MLPIGLMHTYSILFRKVEARMDWMTPIYLLVAFLFVAINGFFVLAEFALVKVRASRVELLARQHNRRAVIAHDMVINLDRYLTATQLGITVASLGLGWIGEPAFAGILDSIIGLPGWWSPHVSHTASTVFSFLIITFLHILLGELAPKSLAIRRPEASTLAIAYPMLWAYRLFYLPMVVLNGASNIILKLVGLEAGHPEVAHTAQEVRMMLATVPTTEGLTLNRLLLLENIFDLGRQTVKDAMVPWARVQSLSKTVSRAEVVRLFTEHRFSRWPVLEPTTGMPIGYLLIKDVITQAPDDPDWTKLIRPLKSVAPTDNLEAVMQRLQRDGSNMAVVVDRLRPSGLITLEDILEEVVGRIEDEFPRLPKLFLKDALTAGAVILDLPGQTPEEAIRALAAAIPSGSLPRGADICTLAIARERQLTTDMGHGVAIPHARCPNLAKPIIVFGRSDEGIVFDARAAEPARLIFLVVTPADRPNMQVFLLEQLAHVAHSELIRERLTRAQSAEELVEIIAAADPAVTG
jgi:CBS domain containing-hemolysin-like protein/mannitol/fructose-specific phosphotransferase system IIA component (Ntr-type)